MAQQKSAQTSVYVNATLETMHCRVLEVLEKVQVSLTRVCLASFKQQGHGLCPHSARPPAVTESNQKCTVDLLMMVVDNDIALFSSA